MQDKTQTTLEIGQDNGEGPLMLKMPNIVSYRVIKEQKTPLQKYIDMKNYLITTVGMKPGTEARASTVSFNIREEWRGR